MARKFASRAEQMRHHRKCFLLSLELGCTPNEAEARLTLIELRERARARAGNRQACQEQRTERISSEPREFQRWDAPWMARG